MYLTTKLTTNKASATATAHCWAYFWRTLIFCTKTILSLLKKKNHFLPCWYFKINWYSSRVLTWLQSCEETQITSLFPLLLHRNSWHLPNGYVVKYRVTTPLSSRLTSSSITPSLWHRGMPWLLTFPVAPAEIRLPSSLPRFKPRLISHTIRELFPSHWKQTYVSFRKGLPELGWPRVLLRIQQPSIR